MDWVYSESFVLGCPAFADELVRCEAAQGLEAATEVVGINEVGEVSAELVMVVVVEAFDGGILDCAVHPLDLAVGPRVLDFGQPVFDADLAAAHVEHMRDPGCGRTVGVARREGELDSVIGQNRVDLVRNRLDQSHEEGRGGDPRGLCLQPDKGEFACPVNANEEMEFALGGLDLGDVDVEIPDGVCLELLLGWFVAIDLRQARDVMALQASVQRRARQMWDRRL